MMSLSSLTFETSVKLQPLRTFHHVACSVMKIFIVWNAMNIPSCVWEVSVLLTISGYLCY